MVLLSRFISVFLCSYLSNTMRQITVIDNKKKFFLWFAGVRGAMAFALAIKAKTELNDKDTGRTFLMLTLTITLFTVNSIIYINQVSLQFHLFRLRAEKMRC